MTTLDFGGRSWTAVWWNGELLVGTNEKPIAFDLETEPMRPWRELREGETIGDVSPDPLHLPRPSLGMACDATRLFLIHPSKFGRFVAIHRNTPIVGHNFSFDWHVLYHHGDAGTKELLWQLGDANRLRDSMVLDMLLQLASGKLRYGRNGGRQSDNDRVYPTNLGVLATEWKVGELDKTDEYRLRFGELLGLSQEQIDAHPEAQNFYSYALKDVLATYVIYPQQRAAGLEWMKRCGYGQRSKRYDIRPDAVEKFGVLTESVQTKASIALQFLSRVPLRIDQQKREQSEANARERYDGHLKVLLEFEPELVKRYKIKKRAGESKKTKRSLLPQFNQKKLVQFLEAEALRLNTDVLKSKGKLKGTSTSAKVWVRLKDKSPFIAAWAELEKEAKLLEFLTTLNAPAVYSRYSLLMMNGRTSAGAYRQGGDFILPSINCQQMLREDSDHPERSVRSLFLPPEGKLWFSCDYGYLELRTLAAVCLAKFGWSRLADAIIEHTKNGGVDPHQRTAAQVMGLPIEAFLRLPQDTQKKARQSSKALNFGFSGGLGYRTFVEYAKATYGADFTPGEAKAAKKSWIATYPEMKLHLADRTAEAMQWQTGKPPPSLSWFQKKRLSDFLRADNAGRKLFSPEETQSIWELLEGLAYAKNDQAAITAIESRKINRAVVELTSYRACTLTGRVRNNTKYTDGANTVYSGLAADGAKMAMWTLLRRGFNVMAFVHDSFDVAVDPRRAELQGKQVEKIMIDSMEAAIGTVPVAVEGRVSNRWTKD